MDKVINHNDRDRLGRFTPGNTAARGRARGPAALERTLDRLASATTLKAVVRTLLAAAKGGDTRAAELLLTLLLGRAQFGTGRRRQPEAAGGHGP